VFDETLAESIAELLGLSASTASRLEIEPCASGGNNRVFTVTLPDRKVVAKRYFSHPSDRRDRLQAEYAFLSYAKHAGIRTVPQPIAYDAAMHLGLYEYIDGRRLGNDEIQKKHVEEAAQFFLRLNQASLREAAAYLPAASEACFSVTVHFSLVDRRVERLETIDGGNEVAREARDFARVLKSRWVAVKRSIATKIEAAGQVLDEAVADRCISPSDFGFHNVLLGSGGRLFFIDFEYAGWDDPAKMAGDFFSHPGVPVHRRWFDDFVGITMGYSPAAKELEGRTRLLLPVFQVKWCCIILNEFLPESAQRRKFADPSVNQQQRQRIQLDKAIALLKVVGVQKA